MQAEQVADLFHEKLCTFTGFIEELSPGCEDVHKFRTLLERAYVVAGSVTITEYVGWYFAQFKDQILEQDTNFLLQFDFEPLIKQMDKNKTFKTYSAMARNLVHMMKETYRAIESESTRTRFNLYVLQLLKSYMLFMSLSERRA